MQKDISKKDKLKTVFKKVLDVCPDKNIQRKDLVSWDSLSHAQLIIYIQKEFDINFKITDLPRLNSFDEILAVVEEKHQADNSE